VKHLDLFSGIGGFALACEWAGIETIGFVEIDKYCQKVLRKHWPNVPIVEDIRDVGEDTFPKPDFITGGFPCQDISIIKSNYGEGLDGEKSNLWFEMSRVIGIYKPQWILIENVPALTFRGLERILCDLAEGGYDAEWSALSASTFGFPHKRERIWIIAYSNGKRFGDTSFRYKEMGLLECLSTSILRLPFLSESPICGMDDGIPNRVDRLKCLGNAIVPQVAYEIIKVIARLELNV